MVEGMTDCTLDFDFCEHYIYEKQIRVRFSSRATRARKIIELIHTDVFGPVPIPSLGKICSCSYSIIRKNKHQFHILEKHHLLLPYSLMFYSLFLLHHFFED